MKVGVCSVMVIGDRHVDPSSNPVLGYFHFTLD